MAGVITAICRAFLARTLAAMNPRHGKSMAPHHGETARHGGVFAALLAIIALLAAACSGSPGSHVAQPGSTTTQSNGALAFSQCMRSYGVPNWPDPNSSGGIPKGNRAATRGQQFPATRLPGRSSNHSAGPTSTRSSCGYQGRAERPAGQPSCAR